MKEIHTTIGLYPNGAFTMNGVDADHLKKHIDYNMENRPGRALFVDGTCVFNGFVSIERIAEFTQRIRNEGLSAHEDTAPYV